MTAACPDWDDSVKPSAKSYGLVLNDVRSNASSKMLDLDWIKKLHHDLFHLVAPHPDYAGQFRQDNKFKPCLNELVGIGGIPGSPAGHVENEMKNLFKAVRELTFNLELNWVSFTPDQRATEIALIVSLSVGHFIAIHPFMNGNGRMSRLNWMWVFARYRIPPLFEFGDRPGWPYSELMRSCMNRDFGLLFSYMATVLTAKPKPTQ